MVAISQMTYQLHFLEWKSVNFSQIFTEVCSYFSIGSDHGLVPNKQQAIIWSKDGEAYWCIYVPLRIHEWKKLSMVLVI